MHNELKKHWDNQFRLSANKVFADFRRYLERGGAKAQEFINVNSDLAETVLGDPDAVDAVLDAIEKDKEAAENQAYFFKQAMGLLAAVRTLLARKYAASVRFCEQLGIDPNDYTPETLLPGVREDEEEDNFNENTGGSKDDVLGVMVELADGSVIEIVDFVDGSRLAYGEDDGQRMLLAPGEYRSNSRVYTVGDGGEIIEDVPAKTDPDENSDPASETEATASGNDYTPETDGEETAEADGYAEETAAETTEETAGITEDDLKAKINVLLGDGASKSEIWQAVAADAEPLGWGAKRVWAYIDEIAPQQ